MSFKRSLAGVALALTVAIGGSSALANQELFAELEQAAQDSRELDLINPLNITVKTREELSQESLASMEEDFPADDTADWQQVLVFMGFLEEDQDIAQIYTDMMNGQILGYYDPTTKELVVVSTGGDEMNVTDKTTFVHETVHAIQDQHFDLVAMQGADESYTDDRYFATTALIEGDATIAESIYLVQNDLYDQMVAEQADLDTGSMEDVPFFLTETLYFPYVQGADFVIHFWQDGGWARVNEVWENPPTTSEQILHPEKYEDGEGAIPVAIADPTVSMEGWRVLEYNENGELGTRVFLQNSGAEEADATQASEGWGGDADFIVTNDQETALVWVSTWDTTDDADEYLETLVDAESGRLGGEFEEIDASTMRLTSDSWVAEIHHNDSGVTYYLAQSDSALQQIIESQEGATIPAATPVGTPDQSVATPVNSIQFWVRLES